MGSPWERDEAGLYELHTRFKLAQDTGREDHHDDKSWVAVEVYRRKPQIEREEKDETLFLANLPVAPSLTINNGGRNGAARVAALDLTYQGYVTPQGEVRMQTPAGQIFVGQIDPYYVLRGRTTGNCVYDAVWTGHGSPRGTLQR